MSKFKITALIDIMFDCKDTADAKSSFESLDLGVLDNAKKNGIISDWDFKDAGIMKIETKKGDWIDA